MRAQFDLQNGLAVDRLGDGGTHADVGQRLRPLPPLGRKTNERIAQAFDEGDIEAAAFFQILSLIGRQIDGDVGLAGQQGRGQGTRIFDGRGDDAAHTGGAFDGARHIIFVAFGDDAGVLIQLDDAHGAGADGLGREIELVGGRAVGVSGIHRRARGEIHQAVGCGLMCMNADLARGQLLDRFDPGPIGLEAQIDLRVGEIVERMDDIVGIEGLAVMPFHVGAQFEIVGRRIGLRDALGQMADELAFLGIKAE